MKQQFSTEHLQRAFFSALVVAACMIALPFDVLADDPAAAISSGLDEGTNMVKIVLNALGGLSTMFFGSRWMFGNGSWVPAAGSVAGLGVINVADQIPAAITSAMGL